jgi:2-oxo-3-hexenedioate decarboxylase
MTITDLARNLEDARAGHSPTTQLTDENPLSLNDAYRVQAAGVDLRLARGAEVTGAKLGFTSAAKAKQMGVSDVILGVLLSDSEVETGGTLDTDGLIHPRVEAEIAFRLHCDLTISDDPRDCVDAVAPALEVIDSRYQNFRFTVEDVVADNTSAAHYAIGPWTTVGDLTVDLATARVELVVNAEIAALGVGADILGDPWSALEAAARLATLRGHRIPAGSVILAGAATEAVPLPHSGTVTARVDGLGKASLVTVGTDR